MRIWHLAIFGSLILGTAALAQDTSEVADWPDGIPTTSIQYSGFLDWVAKRKFAAEGVPLEITNAYWQCIYPEIYSLMEPGERDGIDKAARSNVLTSDAKTVFFERVTERMGGSGKFWVKLLKGCNPQFEDYFFFLKRKYGE